jgi:Trk K+ transport system NAD-binding subunit
LKYTNKIKQDLLIIDYNPMTIKDLQDKKYNAIYGDLQDAEFLDELDMSNTKMIISTVPDFEANALLIKTIKEHKKIDPIIITTSHQISETLELYEMGSTYVVTPYFL